MKSARASFRRLFPVVAAGLFALLLATLPALAADEAAPDPADSPLGLVFRWLNFVLVMGAIAYLIGKFGAPYFRGHAQSISSAIHEAAETRATAERELKEVDERVAALPLAIQDMRRAAAHESAAEAERIRQLTHSELEKIFKTTYTEIQASERASRQELRAVAARLATQRAAILIGERMNRAAEEALFQAFVAELERSPQ